MKHSKKIAAIAVTAALAASAAATPASAAKEGYEKCYGVAKAGTNDCGSKGHGCKGANHECATKPHSCSAMSKHDGDRSEWLYTPKGLCEKLVNGSLKAKDK